jgi:hypothetical protein
VPDYSPKPRARGTVSPTFIARVQRVGWFWFGAIVVGATVVTASASQIAVTVWYLVPAGHVSAPAVIAFPSWGAILFGWVWALAVVIANLANGQLTRPDRTIPMVVAMVFAALGSFYVGALVTSVVLQLGRSVPTAAAALPLLGGPAQLVGVSAFVIAALSLLLVPAFAAARSARPRTAPRKG